MAPSAAPLLLPVMLTLLLAAGLAAAAWRLLATGLRGRQTDDHPVCRRCGFDRWGAPAGTTHCGECGADLAAAGSVRVGHRERVAWRTVAGLLLLQLALGLVGGVVLVESAQVDWQAHKPLWWVLHDAGASDRAVRNAAMATLQARYSRRQLSNAQVDALIARAIDVQGDVRQPWDMQWGDWVQAEHEAGRLPAGQWARYARQAMPPMGLVARARVRRGDPLPYAVVCPVQRCGNGCNLIFVSTGETADVSVDGLPLADQSSLFSNGYNIDQIHARETVATLDSVVSRLPDGPHRLRWRERLAVQNAGPEDGVVLATVDCDASAPFDLQATPTVRLRHDPSLWPAVVAGVPTPELRQDRSPMSPQEFDLLGQMDVVALPVTLGYAVVLHAGDRQWDGGRFSVAAGTGGDTLFRNKLEGLPADMKAVDVEFRPDPAAAAETIDLFEIWDEPLVFKNVSLKR